MEEAGNDQSKALEFERDKRLDATRTLKNSKADLLKAREDLKEMTRARDSVESGLASAQKQAENQTRRLLETEDQLKIAKEQITDLKKKLAEGAKNVAEWARDEALQAKEEAVFTRSEAKNSKEKAEEEAYDLGVVKTQATLKAQVLGVCKLYCSQVWNEALKQAGVEASSDLWKVENVYYPLAIREAAPFSSEVKDAPEEAEAASPGAVLAITVPEELARENEPSGATETSEGLNPDAPQKTVESTGDAQAPHAEEPALLVEPLQAIPLGEGSEDLEVASTQLSKEGAKTKPKK